MSSGRLVLRHPAIRIRLGAAFRLIRATPFRELASENKASQFVPQKSYKRHPYDDSDANFCSEQNGIHLISQVFRVDPRCQGRYAKVLLKSIRKELRIGIMATGASAALVGSTAKQRAEPQL